MTWAEAKAAIIEGNPPWRAVLMLDMAAALERIGYPPPDEVDAGLPTCMACGDNLSEAAGGDGVLGSRMRWSCSPDDCPWFGSVGFNAFGRLVDTLEPPTDIDWAARWAGAIQGLEAQA